MRTKEQVVATLSAVPPIEGCSLKVGDVVTFTNDYGVSFDGMVILGFAQDVWQGRFVHLDKDAYWFPVKPGQCKVTGG